MSLFLRQFVFQCFNFVVFPLQYFTLSLLLHDQFRVLGFTSMRGWGQVDLLILQMECLLNRGEKKISDVLSGQNCDCFSQNFQVSQSCSFITWIRPCISNNKKQHLHHESSFIIMISEQFFLLPHVNFKHKCYSKLRL